MAPERDCRNCGNRAMEPSDMNPYCSAVNWPWGKALHTGKPAECGPESKLWVEDTRGKNLTLRQDLGEVEVVAGILVRDKRVLLVQRRADKDFPLAWECPGGKVEGPETHRDALKREWWEELGIFVTRMEDSPRFEREFSNPVSRPDRARIRLFLYLVEADGTPSPREGQGIGWFTPHEVETLVAAPGLDAARSVVVHALTGVF